jgi:hypothetical protein
VPLYNNDNNNLKHKNFPLVTDCGRDERVFGNAGINFNLRCRDNGNYEPIQDQNGKIFCVDRDGYAVSGLLRSELEIDCDHFIYYAQEDFFILDDVDW